MSFIKLIVATTKDGVIGVRGKGIVWRYPDDLAFFKTLTMGTTLIMGSVTCDEIFKMRDGKALPKRRTMVVTSNPAKYSGIDNVTPVSLDDAWGAATKFTDVDSYSIVGGAQLYNKAIEDALPSVAYVTTVPEHVSGPDAIKFNLDMLKNKYVRVAGFPLAHKLTVEKYVIRELLP